MQKIIMQFKRLLKCERGQIPTWFLLMVLGVVIASAAGTVLQDGLVGTATDKGTAYTIIDKIDAVAGSVDTAEGP